MQPSNPSETNPQQAPSSAVPNVIALPSAIDTNPSRSPQSWRAHLGEAPVPSVAGPVLIVGPDADLRVRKASREGRSAARVPGDPLGEIAAWLHAIGFPLCWARNGYESVPLARRSRPALIVVDLALAPLDAWTATHTLKRGTATRDIPVIGVSCDDGRPQRLYALALGCDEHLAMRRAPPGFGLRSGAEALVAQLSALLDRRLETLAQELAGCLVLSR